MTLANALERIVDDLSEGPSLLVDEYTTTQNPSRDDAGDLDWAVSQAEPLLNALADTLSRVAGKTMALDEALSYLAKRDGVPDSASEAASNLMYFLQRVSYGQFVDAGREAVEFDFDEDARIVTEFVRELIERLREPEVPR